MTALNINFVAVGCSTMVVPRDWDCSCDDDLAPCVGFQIHGEDIVEGAEAVPASENVQFLAYDVSTVCCSWTWEASF